MKRFLRLLLAATVLCGCEGFDFDGNGDGDNGAGLKFPDEADIAPVFTAEGGTVTVAFTSDYDWSVSASDKWILFSPSAGAAGDAELLITLVENPVNAERTGTITITLSNGTTGTITVRQQPFEAPFNEILYTTSDGNAVTLNSTEGFGANIVSNTYENGQGKITFDGDITAIGEEAFSYCDNLTSIIIPNSVTSIGKEAFMGCNHITSITIPDSVTSIGYYVFGNCSGLTRVDIPDSVTFIDEGAFFACSSLTSITIPDSVTEIAGGAFYGCENLEKFEGKFASPDNRCLIVDGAVVAFAPAGLTQYAIPDGVTIIGNNAFCYCENLTSITIPNSVTSIRMNAFVGCGFTNITIPDGVTEIYSFAFQNCRSLTSIVIPAGVTTMGGSVFAGCTNLERFESEFASEDNRCLIAKGGILFAFAPAGLTEYTIPDGVTSIYDYTFMSCYNLTSITIPDSVTSIGDSAFKFCENLSSITIPDGVTSIEGSTFSGCSSLASIKIPDSVTSIGERAFNSCSGLTSVTIGKSVISIGKSAFSSCSSLTSITIPESVTTIGAWAFSYCDNLKSVTIPKNVTSIGELAFYACDNLREVYCKPVTPPSIGEYAFFGSEYSSLQNIYVPTSSVDAYKANEGWNVYSSLIFGYDF